MITLQKEPNVENRNTFKGNSELKLSVI